MSASTSAAVAPPPSTSSTAWTPSSWRSKPVLQDVQYPDPTHLSSVLGRLRSLPGLVTSNSIDQLSSRLEDVANGKAFLLQAGDCAELFQDCTPSKIEAKLRLVLMMSLVIIWGARVPVVRVGRIAGQYGKPRSKDREIVDIDGKPTEVLSFRGDNVNAFDKRNRVPDPERLLQAYFYSTSTINHIRGLLDGGFADLHAPLSFTFDHVRDQALQQSYQDIADSITDSLDFMKTVGADPTSSASTDPSSGTLNRVDYFTSHEGLMLEYEEALTRNENKGGYYNLSTHLLWLGDRTRALDGAHIEYFRGIRNPIGIKVGPSMAPEELVRLLDIVDPDCVKGRVTLIGRFGAGKVSTRMGSRRINSPQIQRLTFILRALVRSAPDCRMPTRTHPRSPSLTSRLVGHLDLRPDARQYSLPAIASTHQDPIVYIDCLGAQPGICNPPREQFASRRRSSRTHR